MSTPPLYIVVALALALAALAAAGAAWQLRQVRARAPRFASAPRAPRCSRRQFPPSSPASIWPADWASNNSGFVRRPFMLPRRYFCSRSRPGSASSTARSWRLGIPAAGLAIPPSRQSSSVPTAARLRWRCCCPRCGARRRSSPGRKRRASRARSRPRGKVVLVNFWATWCGPCRHEMPMLSAMQARYADRGLVVVYLSLEEREVVEPFLRANPFDRTAGTARAGRRLLPGWQVLSDHAT